MQHIDAITATYQQRSQEAGKQLNRIVTQIRQVSILRVCLFVAGVSAAIFLRHSSWWMITGALLVTFVPYLWLIKVHSRMFRRRAYLEKRQEVNDQELRALEHDYSSFENGKEFTDPAHLYTYDLDVFGEKSLFQYINRTVTGMGRKQLASWMIHHLRCKKRSYNVRKAYARSLLCWRRGRNSVSKACCTTTKPQMKKSSWPGLPPHPVSATVCCAA